MHRHHSAGDPHRALAGKTHQAHCTQQEEQKEDSMKLVGSITLATPKGDKQIANTLDLGDAPDAQLTQHSLHQMLGQMANMIGLHQGATFRALSVTTDSQSSS
jgi:hypothetical protein